MSGPDTGLELQDVATVDENDIIVLYQSFRARATERDERMDRIDHTVAGDWKVLDPNGDEIEDVVSPNLIQVALEDTAESAGIMPTIRVKPARSGIKAKEQAAAQEKIGAGYFDVAQMDAVIPETVLDLSAFGFAAWLIWPDFGKKLPLIEKLDPRFVYPDPDIRQGRDLKRCMIVRSLRLGQLPAEYQDQLVNFFQGNVTMESWAQEHDHLTLIEFWTDHDYTCAALFLSATSAMFSTTPEYHSVILDQWEHGLGTCPVIYEQRPTLDRQPRGQFDQVIDPFEAHVRLMGMVMDYADQAVYSDVWVKDLIGEMSFGGGAYIELGANGAIGRVPPAVSSLNIQQDIERLVDAIHLGGRWPKSRPGEVDQSIASAKFIEAAAGMMNTALRTYHMLLQRMMERALRVAYMVDLKYFPEPKSSHGVLRNQEFIVDYDPRKDIDLKCPIRVEYGLGLGRDPGQSAILMLQYAQNGYISHEFVQENIEGIVDVERERRRIDMQDFQGMAKARLLQGLTDGSVPMSALPDIADARDQGEDLIALFRKYVVEPQAQQPFAGVAPAASPGLGPASGGPPGGAPPGAPGPGGPALQPPPAPDPTQMFQRLEQRGMFSGSDMGAQYKPTQKIGI